MVRPSLIFMSLVEHGETTPHDESGGEKVAIKMAVLVDAEATTEVAYYYGPTIEV